MMEPGETQPVAEPIHPLEPEPRRSVSDRRRRPTRMLSRYTLVGRRRGNRRATDPQSNYFVDFARGSNLVALILVLLLILADTVSTLHIVNRGGGEANPLMRWMLELSPFWFAFVKTASALAAFLLLGVHVKWSIGRRLTALLLLAYGALIVWHVTLLLKIHG